MKIKFCFTLFLFVLIVSGYAIQHQSLPDHFYKNNLRRKEIETVILYNNYHGKQHSYIMLESVK